MISIRKILYLASIISLSLSLTTCRHSSRSVIGFCFGKVLVINETLTPSGAPDCLTAEVFAANQIQGNPIDRLSTCDSIKEISAPPGDYFVKIRGDESQKELFSNFVSVTCNGVTTLTIVQRPVLLPLTVETTGGGNGRVKSQPLGIDCGQTCQHFYQSGTAVTLHAEADPSSDFAGWTGACGGRDPKCTVIVSELKRVTAVFHPKALPPNHQRLTILVSGNGSGVVQTQPILSQCRSNCATLFPTNSDLILTPFADRDSVFVGWSGACAGLNPCRVKIAGPTAVEARFVRQFHPSENRIAVKNYNPLTWELFNRAFHPLFEERARRFKIPDTFHVTRGCSGNQWVTLKLAIANLDGMISEHICIYRDRDPLLDNTYSFDLCTTFPLYESECATVIDGARCQRAAIQLHAGNVITPLELQLFLTDGDASCGTTVISSSVNQPGDDDGDTGNGNDDDDSNDDGSDDGDDNGNDDNDEHDDPNHHGKDHRKNGKDDDPNHHGDEHGKGA